MFCCCALLLCVAMPAAGARTVYCEGLEALIIGTTGDDTLRGTTGDDVIHGRGGADHIDGRGGNDTICGGNGNDVIAGGNGNDRIQGGKGADTIIGDDGDDVLFGGPGLDTIKGVAGNDHLDGGPGADLLLGGSGSDQIKAGEGHDTVRGGDGDDSITGGNGNDIIQGEGGADDINGETGQDLVEGGDGDDTVRGGRHPDRVFGGPGDDRVFGGPGDDLLVGGEGIDKCNGGGGTDEAAECEIVISTDIGQLPPPRSRPSAGAVALTFDDGPHPIQTPQVLDILGRYNVKATFFVTGWNARTYPDLLRDIIARGHSVQNHTYNHGHLPSWSSTYVAQELQSMNDVITEITGTTPRCYRPPFGDTSARVRAVAEGLGLTEVMWDFSGADWLDVSVSAIVRLSLRAEGGDVVLLHDGGGYRGDTIRALPYIIEGFQEKGLTFETLCN